MAMDMGGICKKWNLKKVKRGTLRRERGAVMAQMLFIIGKNIAPSYRFVSSVSPPGTTFTVNSHGSALWAAVQERPRLAQTSWQGGDYLSFGCGSQNIMQRLEIDLAERNTAQLLWVAKTGVSWSVGFCHAACWDGGNNRSWVDSICMMFFVLKLYSWSNKKKRNTHTSSHAGSTPWLHSCYKPKCSLLRLPYY